MAFATGRHMARPGAQPPSPPTTSPTVVHDVHAGRVVFHDGDDELASGLSVHLLGGHTAATQVVRVRTAGGWLVLASDASHYYENMEAGRPFPIVYDVGAMLDGYDTLRRAGRRASAIVPGHDPLVLERYPAAGPGLEGIAVRLDEGRVGA